MYKLLTPQRMEPYSNNPPTAEPLKLDPKAREVSPNLRRDSENITPAKANGKESSKVLNNPLYRMGILANVFNGMMYPKSRLRKSRPYTQFKDILGRFKTKRLAHKAMNRTPEIANELTNQVVPKRSANSVMALNSMSKNAANNERNNENQPIFPLHPFQIYIIPTDSY